MYKTGTTGYNALMHRLICVFAGHALLGLFFRCAISFYQHGKVLNSIREDIVIFPITVYPLKIQTIISTIKSGFNIGFLIERRNPQERKNKRKTSKIHTQTENTATVLQPVLTDSPSLRKKPSNISVLLIYSTE